MDAARLSAEIARARAAAAARAYAEAGAIAAALLRDDPACLDALEIKAIAAEAGGDVASAEAALRTAVAAAPGRRWPYDDLGRLLLRQGRRDEAEAVARAAVAADDDNPDAHAMLGSLLAEREALVAGAAHLERAISLAGRHPDLLARLGGALARQGRLDEARPLLAEALAAAPDSLAALTRLAEVEERAGAFAAASALLDRAERVAARSGRDVLLQRSVLMQRMGRAADALALLDRRNDLSGAARLQRGRLRDAAGRHAEAWDDFVAGKAQLARASGRHYAADEVAARAGALARFFTAERLARLPRASVRRDVPQPLFVLGFPRSGTTLTEQLLASHSQIRAGGELPFGRDLADFATALVGGPALFPDGLARMTAADHAHWPALLRDHYLAQAEAVGLLAPGAAFFTDKMPLNDMWLALLRLAFPEAPVVLVRRHPLDVLVSVMAHDMTHGFHCGYRLEDAARHLALIDDLVARYQAAGILVTHELGYEALVADQAGETDRLMAAVGLAVEPAQRRFHESRRIAPTPSYAQVQAPLNDRSIGRWRHHDDRLAPIRDIVAGAIARGGYTA